MSDIVLATGVAYTYDAAGIVAGAIPCPPDPLEPGHWLVPAHATLTPPPATAAGEVAVWTGAAWVVVADHRGATAWDTTTGRPATVTAPGPLPDGLTLLPPAAPWDRWDADLGAWVADPDARRTTLLAALADLRWRRETGGVVVGEVAVASDRASQAMLTGAALSAQLAAQAGEDYTVRWKAASGWVTLTGAEVLALAQAVRAHVQGSFDAEAAVAGAVQVGEITDLPALEAAWTATTSGA